MSQRSRLSSDSDSDLSENFDLSESSGESDYNVFSDESSSDKSDVEDIYSDVSWTEKGIPRPYFPFTAHSGVPTQNIEKVYGYIRTNY